jgi:phosphatidylserine/phosphatidylglycerophosphate/cardiolipin synthase-like enzyme
MSLQELKEKWFVNISDQDAFPPQARYPGSKIKPHTDGNLVEPLIDGAAIMGDFYRRLETMIQCDDPSETIAMLAAMGIDPVMPLGEDVLGEDIKTKFLEAAEKGVNVYMLVSGQPGLGVFSESFSKKLNEKGGHGAVDNRFAGFAGGHHQKFNITRDFDGEWTGIASSADFFFARWDTPSHSPENPARSKKGGPTHDTGLKVKGPGVRDLVLSFIERWNDPSSAFGTSPAITDKIEGDFPEEEFPEAGPHSVQVLRTYPIIDGKKKYSWSDVGEYTI